MSGSVGSPAPRIFVSHSHEDDEYCRAFVDELRRLCGDRDAVWYDEHNLTSGELMREIQRQLHLRPVFVVIFTQASLRRSQWVADECTWAYQLYRSEPGRTILPVTGGPIERADFIPYWLYLEDFRRIEAPGMQPFPPVEAARRTYAALAGTQVAAAPASMPGKPEPTPAPIQPQSAPAVQQRPAPRSPQLITLPRERFPERLERLGFVAQVTTDPDTGNKTTLIRPPLCRVSEGPFLMGSTPRQDISAFDDEKPQITVDLPAYQIARFPVTVAEYACFVETGHLAPAGWDTLQRNLDYPIVNVSWYDARDYAAWLAALTGEPWKLPSEAEWEKAARWDPKGNGGRGLSRIYPWGKDFDARRCNTSAFTPTIGTMTPVGTYGPEQAARDGSSPYGVQDMAGTVWEWTRTIYDAQAYSKKTFRDGTNSAEDRVQRGGSYGDPAFRVARAACRHGNRPDYGYVYAGFRVVLLSAA